MLKSTGRFRIAETVLALSAAVALSGCGGDTGDNPAAHTTQIAQVQAAPETIQCRTFVPGTAVARTIQFDVRMVNTRAEDVTISGIGSRGIVIRAHSDALVGKTVWQLASLPYTPSDAIIRAADGNVTLSVLLDITCVPGGAAVPDFQDIDVTLTVRTSVGEFASTPVTIHQAYN